MEDILVNRNQVIVKLLLKLMVQLDVVFVMILNHLDKVLYVQLVLLVNVLNIKKNNHIVCNVKINTLLMMVFVLNILNFLNVMYIVNKIKIHVLNVINILYCLIIKQDVLNLILLKIVQNMIVLLHVKNVLKDLDQKIYVNVVQQLQMINIVQFNYQLIFIILIKLPKLIYQML